MGTTSGASYLVAEWAAHNWPNMKVAAIFPDDGFRYEQTVYNDAYVNNLPNYTEILPAAPRTVTYAREEFQHWSRLVMR